MNKDKILNLLSELNDAAIDYNEYDFGLPIYNETEAEFVKIVETWLAAQSLNVEDGG